MKKQYIKTSRTGEILILLMGILLAAGPYSLYAQSRPLPCGDYKIDETAVKNAMEFEKRNLNSIQSVTYQVMVYFTILTDDDGTNAAATTKQVLAEYNQLVSDYAGGGICFINAGIGYVNSTAINTNFNANTSPSSTFNPYLVANCLNIFYMKAIGGNNGACQNCGYGGITLGIPNTFCLVASGNLGAGHTTSHETGHCLGLLHTFDFSHGYEDIDGTNSSTAGDLITDTPADPYGYNAQTCYSVSSNKCTYTGTCTDPKGKSNFSPPYSNTMAYWWNNSCYSALAFTSGQFTRAKSTLSTYSGLISCQSSSSPVVEGPNLSITSGYTMASSASSITTNGTVSISGAANVMFAGQIVYLQPGFTAQPSTGGIVLLQPGCSTGTGAPIKSSVAADATQAVTNAANALMVFPNPANSYINVVLSPEHNVVTAVLQLYDINGREVKEMSLKNLLAGKQNIKLDLMGYAQGVYYLTVRMDNGTLSAKVVVVR